MPQKRSKPEPPVMTRSKRLTIVIAAAFFDLARLFFTFFWFLGPALAALYCTVKGTALVSSWTFGLLGAKTAATVCGGAALAIGSAGVVATAPIGIIMADAFALIGFLVLGLWINMTNARIVKTVASAPLWFAGAFALGAVPLIGSFPAFSVVLWRLYGAQIQAEEAEHGKWERENAAAEIAERNEQAARVAQLMQEARVAQVAQAGAQAANDAVYAEAANDAEYTQKLKRAA